MKISCQWDPCSQKEIETTAQVVAVFREHSKNERIVDALKTLGNIHRKLLQIDEAVKYYQEGLNILETVI